jgi:hypothetical protein
MFLRLFTSQVEGKDTVCWAHKAGSYDKALEHLRYELYIEWAKVAIKEQFIQCVAEYLLHTVGTHSEPRLIIIDQAGLEL